MNQIPISKLKKGGFDESNPYKQLKVRV